MSGIEKSVDELGRIVLPIKFRKKLGLQNKSKVIISLNDNSIFITPTEACCAVCGGYVDVNLKLRLCRKCIKKVKES